MGGVNWQTLFVLSYLSQVNEVHAIAHRRNDENNKFVHFLQKIGLLQSNLHHGWHHKAPYDCNYCILTMYLNPFLNRIRFWQFLENTIEEIFKVKPLRGTEIRGGI
jgi:ubiquitin-conjugating enzyme E2 variant